MKKQAQGPVCQTCQYNRRRGARVMLWTCRSCGREVCGHRSSYVSADKSQTATCNKCLMEEKIMKNETMESKLSRLDEQEKLNAELLAQTEVRYKEEEAKVSKAVAARDAVRAEINELKRERMSLRSQREGVKVDQLRETLRERYPKLPAHKFDLVFSKAWDLGHSAGYSEVEHYFDELQELAL